MRVIIFSCIILIQACVFQSEDIVHVDNKGNTYFDIVQNDSLIMYFTTEAISGKGLFVLGIDSKCKATKRIQKLEISYKKNSDLQYRRIKEMRYYHNNSIIDTIDTISNNIQMRFGINQYSFVENQFAENKEGLEVKIKLYTDSIFLIDTILTLTPKSLKSIKMH
jgi:hypothetical protein